MQWSVRDRHAAALVCPIYPSWCPSVSVLLKWPLAAEHFSTRWDIRSLETRSLSTLCSTHVQQSDRHRDTPVREDIISTLLVLPFTLTVQLASSSQVSEDELLTASLQSTILLAGGMNAAWLSLGTWAHADYRLF